MLTLLLFSDTHGHHHHFRVRNLLDVFAPQLTGTGSLPPVDVAVHLGDIGLEGSYARQVATLNSFATWFTQQPGTHKLVVAGNHDFLAEEQPHLVRDTLAQHGIVYLHHQAYTLPSGHRVFGSPYTPAFLNWANMRQPQDLDYLWEKIPLDTEILLTHGPALDRLDQMEDGRHIGDPALAIRVRRLHELLLHAHGHVHSARGYERSGENTLFVNAACCDERNRPVHVPLLVTIP
jgi:Calcineurin-like phosphoesterase